MRRVVHLTLAALVGVLTGALGGALAALGFGGALSGCGSDEGVKITFRPCVADRGFPYPPTVPYVGVHANPQNNDLVACDASPSYVQVWHALQGFAIAQPNTFSPDGQVTYVTTSQP